MLKEFKEFAMRGNVVDMAVGIVIGAAFGVIIKSFVADVIMPPIGLLLGNVDFAIFMVIRAMNAAKKKEEAPPAEPTDKECPHCLSKIAIKATRCAFCTSEV